VGNHNPTNQKGRQNTKNVFKKWINIYVLPFKAMAIMASYCFFSHMNVKDLKKKYI